jgi:hypothetical protein
VVTGIAQANLHRKKSRSANGSYLSVQYEKGTTTLICKFSIPSPAACFITKPLQSFQFFLRKVLQEPYRNYEFCHEVKHTRLFMGNKRHKGPVYAASFSDWPAFCSVADTIAARMPVQSPVVFYFAPAYRPK